MGGKKKNILQKMIAVEACGISSNALLMVLPSPQHIQATAQLLLFMMLPLTADTCAAIFYIKTALMKRNIKNTQPNYNQLDLLLRMSNAILMSATIQTPT